MTSKMTIKRACEILKCSEDADKNIIKKKYRSLMQKVHPDANPVDAGIEYTVHEVIEAYNLLMNQKSQKKNKVKKPKVKNWDAPENDLAYAPRKIFQNFEDYDGSVIGTVEVDYGKYIWKTEEDFPLFLKSIYECSKDLLTDFDEEEKMKRQPQLSFLLAQQFIDGLSFLEKYTKKVEDNIYYIPAMLEQNASAKVRVGLALYPQVIKNHKLYLQNKSGNEVGYLSFKDDRLYYCLIPLFEQKRVQVKIQVSDKQDRYKNLNLWVKLIEVDTSAVMESLNSQIDRILQKNV